MARYLKFLFFIFFAFAVIVIGASSANAASYYVSPSGSGSTCSNSNPCSLNEGLNRAGAGDEVVLKDGVYRQYVNTKRSGSANASIVIRAQNRRKATILNPNMPVTPNSSTQVFDINHSYITVRSLVIDGNAISWDTLRVHGTSANRVTNIIIEDNHITNTGGKAIGMHHYTSNVIIRHNTLDKLSRFNFQEAGFTPNSSPFYQGSGGSNPADDFVSDVEIYGNTADASGPDWIGNLIDLKRNAKNYNIHHNVFDNLVDGNDGCISIQGLNIDFHDNIVRNSDCGSAIFDYVKLYGNQNHRNNVIYNIGPGGRFAWYNTGSNGLQPTIITKNTFCNLASYVVEQRNGGGSSSPDGLVITQNTGFPGGAPQSACDEEEQQILNEMKNLPGYPRSSTNGTTGPCHTLTSANPAPSDFGASYNTQSAAKELLLKATCSASKTDIEVGTKTNYSLYIWKTVYEWSGSSWKAVNLSCSGVSAYSDKWCLGSATASIPTTANWYAAYSCFWSGSAWKCGCRDSACTQRLWQLQGIDR